jgi:lipopolysaccharide export system permease protein
MLARRVPLYLLRETVPLYAVGVLTILVLLMIDYFASLLGYALVNRPPLSLVLQSLADRVPFFLSYMLAPALAFALPVGLGRLAKDSELKALYATGVRPLSLTWVLLAFGVLVMGLSFINANYWQPDAEARFKTTWYRLFNAEPSKNLDTKSYASTDGETIFHAGTIAPRADNPKTADLYGVVVISPEGTFTATRGLWDATARQWELYSPFRTDAEGRLDSKPEIRRTFAFETALEPDARLPENLSLPELMERAQRTEGISVQDAYEANYRLQRRFADPLAALVMAFAGALFGLLTPNRAFAFAGTIAIVAVYWGLWITGQNLAAAQAVPYWVAAWLPPVVFALGSIYGLRRLS